MKQAEPLVTKARLETLSDGVFAIVMTLLVFNLIQANVTDAVTTKGIHSALYALWPKFLAFTVSFLVVSVLWVAHHTIMSCVRGSDENHLWLNLLFLFSVTLIPFSADIVGEHHGFAVGGVLYGMNLACCFLLLSLNIWYVSRRLLHAGANPVSVQLFQRRLQIGVAFYVAGMVISVLLPKAAVVSYFAIIALHVLAQLRSPGLRELLRFDPAIRSECVVTEPEAPPD